MIRKWIFPPAALSLILLLNISGCGGSSATDSENASPSPQMQSYTITTTTNGGGTIVPVSTTLLTGRSATFEIQTGEDYEIDHVAGCEGNLNNNRFNVINIRANCEITVTFVAMPENTDNNPPVLNMLFTCSVTWWLVMEKLCHCFSVISLSHCFSYFSLRW